MPRRRAPQSRRRVQTPTDTAQGISRLDQLGRRPQLQGTRLVPVVSQMPDVDDSYGFVSDAAPLIGNSAFPENPYDGQHFWLHHTDTREMTLFIFCEHYGKWVSSTYHHSFQTTANFTTVAGSYDPTSSSQMGRVTIQNAEILWDMGVRFEVQLAGSLRTDQVGELANAVVARYEWDEHNPELTFAERSLPITSNAFASFSLQDEDWHDITTIQPIRKNATFVLQVKRDVGTSVGSFGTCSFSVRLTSATV